MLDYISCKNVIHCSYCFANFSVKKHDYAVTYFEFVTKDSANKKPESNGLAKVGEMLYSSNNNKPEDENIAWTSSVIFYSLT